MRSIFVTTLFTVLSTGPAAPPLRVSAPATVLQPGSVILLTIAGESPLPAVRARAFGRKLSLFPVDGRTWQVLVGIDLDAKPGSYPVEIEAPDSGTRDPGTRDPGTKTTYLLTVTPRRFPTRTLTVDPDLVNPPQHEMARIAREAERLRRLWDAPPGARIWDGPFIRPVPDAANSSFGTRSIYNGQSRSPHGGTDFLSGTGRAIKAPNAGRVVLAESLYFTGGTVVLDHGASVLSLFAHLSSIGVHEGDIVKTGDVIGEVGATGRVTGPHLHWAVRVDGARVDPLRLLSALEGQTSR
jgi:murein DD-endopeptidase MepM/ murein hydrolase activator NlpD